VGEPGLKARPGAQQLFVYGTLRSGMSHRHVLEGRATLVCEASVGGSLFDVGEYPGAVASASPSDRVVGELYRVDVAEAAALFAELDRYEGFDPARPASSEFVRVRIGARTEGGGSVEAWMYRYNRPTRGLKRIGSGDYKSAPERGSRPAQKR
jgi:gamma-glutamylcyclotransferase (GGCT)/AIG2-like uncharacterized protein YtfP